ncbi:MAG: hypothetical protein ACKOQS_20415, partial [Dolichospermum sp.]
SESWEFSLGEKPLIGVIKLAIGVTVSWNSTAKITKEISSTYAQINETYQEIRSSEGFNFQLPSMGISLLVGLSAIALIGFFKKLSSGENNNEI